MIRQMSALDMPALMAEPEVMSMADASIRMKSNLGSSRLVLWCVDNVALYFERARPWSLTEAEDLAALFNQDFIGFINRDGTKQVHQRIGAAAHRFEPITRRVMVAA